MPKLPPVLTYAEIEKVLAKLPREVKLDLTQFGLDLAGLIHPAADAVNAGISFLRGDYIGAIVSAASIIPIGDVLKITRLGKHAKTIETLVTRVVPSNPALYKELEPVMEQFRRLLARIPDGNAAVESVRNSVATFFKNAELHRLASGVKGLENFARVAKRRGRWKSPAYAKAGTTPGDVVDRLMDAASGGSVTLRRNAKEAIEQMSRRDWVISAGPHKTTAVPGKSVDRTPHITLEIAGHRDPWHVRLDAKGRVWEIRTMPTGGGSKPVNLVPGTPRPWQRPGS